MAPVRIPRPLLWLLLAIFAVANMVTSTSDLNMFVGIGFGLATLACAAALIQQHYARRRD
ncbi:hypothetical protein [Nonomuraea jabiensis]|uniref:Uncharacterized protein n=1 Tax=Nonomuraea jabiensis TaxID=882448 RepID=A0A7W9G1H2_9ACTN|nr:hypothetical protein [Nonomuraea jabiensis]MBB5775520.1 hypothetical protein [Nonomuraea jabiensis]